MKKALIAITIAAILGGGLVFASTRGNDATKNSNNSQTISTSSSTTQQTTSSTQSSVNDSIATSTGQNASFTLNANDETASIKTINVSKGAKVVITIKVDTNQTYYGGLNFRSDVVSTGTIKPGESKTIEFTADKSFELVPYWAASYTKKNYVISVNVN